MNSFEIEENCGEKKNWENFEIERLEEVFDDSAILW